MKKLKVKNQEEKNKKIVKKRKSELGYREMLLIADLYDLRYITTEQANRYYYVKEDGTNARMDWTYRKLNLLVKEGLLDTVLFPMNLRFKKLYYLTEEGINKALDLRDEELFRLDLEGNLRQMYRSASENLLDERDIRHQLFLNEIYFTFLTTLKREEFEWKDTAKSMIDESNIRLIPDATVTINHINYLIEADNDTISAKRLIKKMRMYNKFLEKTKDLDEEYKVLFICNTEKRKNKDKRIDSIIDVVTAEVPVCMRGIDFYVMSIENFRTNFYDRIYEQDVEDEKTLCETITERLADKSEKRYETDYKYNTLYGTGIATGAIIDGEHVYAIEDLTIGNIKNYQRFREAVKLAKYGQITPIAIVADENRARIEADRLRYIPYALFYLLDSEKIVSVLPDEIVEKGLKRTDKTLYY